MLRHLRHPIPSHLLLVPLWTLRLQHPFNHSFRLYLHPQYSHILIPPLQSTMTCSHRMDTIFKTTHPFPSSPMFQMSACTAPEMFHLRKIQQTRPVPSSTTSQRSHLTCRIGKTHNLFLAPYSTDQQAGPMDQQALPPGRRHLYCALSCLHHNRSPLHYNCPPLRHIYHTCCLLSNNQWQPHNSHSHHFLQLLW